MSATGQYPFQAGGDYRFPPPKLPPSIAKVRSGSDGSLDPCTTTSWSKEFPSGSSRYSDKSASERPTNPNRSAGRIEIQSSDDKHEPKKRSTRTIWLLVPRHISRNGGLRSSLEDHVERPRSGLADLRKPTLANDFGELRLTRLRTQAFADFLVQ
jgi:hypothetical protein